MSGPNRLHATRMGAVRVGEGPHNDGVAATDGGPATEAVLHDVGLEAWRPLLLGRKCKCSRTRGTVHAEVGWRPPRPTNEASLHAYKPRWLAYSNDGGVTWR